MTKRVKKIVCAGITREQAEAAFSQFAQADAEEQQLMADMDAQIARIREHYRPLLQERADQKATAFEQMQSFAIEHKSRLFTQKRSLETPYGTFGFRTTTPALKTRPGFTWPAVTELLKQHLPAFVRVKEEPAKDRLIAAVRHSSDAAIPLSALEKCGLYVDQSETFFVDCKKEKMVNGTAFAL